MAFHSTVIGHTFFFFITISNDVMEAYLYSNKNLNWVKKKICCERGVTLADGVVLWHQGTKFVCLQTPVVQFQGHLPNVNVDVANIMPIYTQCRGSSYLAAFTLV